MFIGFLLKKIKYLLFVVRLVIFKLYLGFGRYLIILMSLFLLWYFIVFICVNKDVLNIDNKVVFWLVILFFC